MIQLHDLKPNPGSRKKRKRLGRGNASGRGTYSGRGMKGQKARAGGKKGLKQRALKEQLISKTPKVRGFKSLYKKMEIVNIGELEKRFEEGAKINQKILFEKRLIRDLKNRVKILGEGKLTKKLVVAADAFSKSARQAIRKAGGEIIRT